MNTTIRLILGGDMMLGRLVKEAILSYGIDYPLGKIAPLMRKADLTIVNLECAITTNPNKWSGAAKAFYFGAPPEATQTLRNCGVKLVNLANNHILDYDVKGLLDTLHFLEQADICYAGAGKNSNEAARPALITIKNITFGMVGFCDHQLDFAALASQPGMSYLDLDDEEKTIKQFKQSLNTMLKEAVDYPILSLHWGPNMVHRPSALFRRIAHSAIDMGYKLLYGHSAHVFQGIEIYRNCPIIYAAGDLVDDYYVDPEFKNDHQLLFEIEIDEGECQQMILHPLHINRFQTSLAQSAQFDFIANRAKKLCNELGTTIARQGESLIIPIT